MVLVEERPIVGAAGARTWAILPPTTVSSLPISRCPAFTAISQRAAKYVSAAALPMQIAASRKRSHRMVLRDGRGRGVGRAFHMLPMRFSGSSMTISSGTVRCGKGRATGRVTPGATSTSAVGMSSRSWTGVAGAAARTALGGSSAHGDWICFQHDGQGPLIPAILSGTLSLMPQAGQEKITESVAIRVAAF